MLILGDLNARHTTWGDTRNNQAGRILAQFGQDEQMLISSPTENTFLCDNGGSVIDLALMTPELQGHIWKRSVDTEIELFTGAPHRGHVPVWTTFRLVKPSKPPRYMHDWKRADWSLYHKLSLHLVMRLLLDYSTSQIHMISGRLH
jgi:hypothetical protein